MFKVGDLIIYSSHGLCRIDDICERPDLREGKRYYILHPVEDSKLKISVPVDNDKVNMLELLGREEAEEIIGLFEYPGASWIDINSKRNEIYSEVVKTGNRQEISKVVNTLMRKKYKTENAGKKFHERDQRLLSCAKNILFTELAIALDTTNEAIEDRVNEIIANNES